MPKQNLTFNGFNGGLNEYSDKADLVSDGSGAEECYYNENLMLDAPGKISTIRPEGKNITDYTHNLTLLVNDFSNGETFNSSGNLLDQHILQKDSTLYKYQGVFSLGDYVNWSKNSDFQVYPPTSGTLTGTSAITNGHNIDCKSYRANDKIVFQGTSASQSEGDAIIMSGSRADGDDSKTQVNIDVEDIFRQMQDGDADGHLGEGNTYMQSNGREIDNSFTDYDEGDWLLYTNSVAKAVNQTSDEAELENCTEWAFYKNNTNQDSTALIFRTGRAEIHSEGDWQNGPYGTGMNINGCGVAIEVYTPRSLGNLEAIYVVADCGGDDMETNIYGTGTTAGDKVWKFTGVDLQEAGTGSGWRRLTLNEDASVFTSNTFNPLSVVYVWVYPKYSAGTTSSGANTGVHSDLTQLPLAQVRLRELSFFKESIVESWGNDKYNLFQTRVVNDIESMVKQYSGTFDASPTPMKLTVYKCTTTSPQKYKGKIYYEGLDPEDNVETDRFMLCETDWDKGIKAVDGDTWVPWTSNQAQLIFDGPPIVSTYTLESGYPEGTEYINARWKHSAVNGRQVYIGNVQQPIDDTIHQEEWNNGKILKGAIGKPGGFSDKVYIDLELGEGSITCMRSLGDRLFVFSRTKLVIINVAQDNEFLEETVQGMGVANPAQVVEVDGRLFIVNGSGVTLFDGQSFKKINQKIERKWNIDSSRISYEPVRQNLFVWAHSTKLYLYNVPLGIWVYKTGVSNYFNNNSSGGGVPSTNTIILSRPPGNVGTILPSTCGVYHSKFTGTMIRWCVLRYAGPKVIDNIQDDMGTYAYSGRDIRSGVIVFRNAPQRKKFYTVYINVRLADNSDSTGTTTGTTFWYSIDRGENWTYVNSQHGPYMAEGENKFDIGVTAKDFMFRIMGSNYGGVEYGDISIVYREKSLK